MSEIIKPRKFVRLIRQKESSDCAICCLAMLTGMRHRDIVRKVGDAWIPGKGMYKTKTALVRLGFREKMTKIKTGGWKVENIDFSDFYCPTAISPQFFRQQIWGRRALLSVPSLNIEGGMHMVYWHYDRLYDPSVKKTYKEFHELKPQDMILFMERPVD